MTMLQTGLHILVIEDNPGDFVLIQEYLLEEIQQPEIEHAANFADAREILTGDDAFDAILLDLDLPDAGGEPLVEDVVELSGSTPVVVLTGYENEQFGLKTLSTGVADYLLKDELNPFLLYKSIAYSIERSRINHSLRESEQQYRDLFDLTPLPKAIYDIETLQFLDVNQTAIDHYGYSRDEFLSMTIKDIRPEEDIPELEKILEESHVAEGIYHSGVFRHLKKDGELIYVDIQSSRITYNGREAKIVVANDITERLETEKQLALSEKRFKSLVQDGSDFIAILDEKGNYKYMSPTYESVLGMPPDEYVGENSLDFIHEEDRKRILEVVGDLENSERVELDPYRFRNSDGNWIWAESTITNMSGNPAVEGYVINSRDVTEQIERQRELQESVERYDIVSKATSDTIWDLNLETDTNRYNSNIYSMFGYEKQQVEEPAEWWREKLHPEDREYVITQIEEALTADSDRFQMEYRFQCADGSYKHIYDRAFIVNDEKGNPVRMIGAMQDVTRQRDEQKWLQIFESAIANTKESVAIIEHEPTDLPGRKILYVNKAFCEMTGYSAEEAKGETLNILNGPQTSQEKRNKLRDAMDNWESVEVEFINYRKDGEKFWIRVSMTPVEGANNSRFWVCIGREITEEKQQERALKDSVKEKETLLLEIHHRVKNNLAVVSGMMQLQAFEEDDQKIKRKLFDGIARIQTMGNIHELLYQSESFTEIAFHENLKKLTDQITNTFQSNVELQTEFNFDEVDLNINQAIPCSLIVNEVITNVLKHAFGDRKKGRLSISMREENKMIHIHIEDNGSGLPKDFEQQKKVKSLGLKLIDTLAKQIEADYKYVSLENGTQFKISFGKAKLKGIGSSHLM